MYHIFFNLLSLQICTYLFIKIRIKIIVEMNTVKSFTSILIGLTETAFAYSRSHYVSLVLYKSYWDAMYCYCICTTHTVLLILYYSYCTTCIVLFVLYLVLLILYYLYCIVLYYLYSYYTTHIVVLLVLYYLYCTRNYSY